MSCKNKVITSEYVSFGHPDKLADQIADAILDELLKQDKNTRSGIEVLVKDNVVVLGGEVRTTAIVNYDAVVKRVFEDVHYPASHGLKPEQIKVINLIGKQSIEIHQGVDKSETNIGAGDQGFCVGYASNETSGYMPLAISIAHKLVREATLQRKSGAFKHARPDMKSQVTIDYTDPSHVRIDTILMSVQHDDGIDLKAFKQYAVENIMKKVAESFGLNTDFKVFFNPTGLFVIGGPTGDTGVTGRKIIVDTYGGTCEHGGGAFSGKDPTKVDRSAAYMARYIAKNLVAAGIANRLRVQLSYAIGVNEPLSINVRTYKTSKYSDDLILSIVRKVFDCRPGMIIKHFNLTEPSFKYHELTNYGHFGRPDLDLPWEKLDKVDEIKSLLK